MLFLFSFLLIIVSSSFASRVTASIPSNLPVIPNEEGSLRNFRNKVLSRKLKWTFIEETIDNDEWYTYYDEKTEVPVDFTSPRGDKDDYLRYTDICPNTQTKTYSYENCLLIETTDCSNVQENQPPKGQWGEAKLCINRAPFSDSITSLFYVVSMKCIPKWENCDKCLCGLIDNEGYNGKCEFKSTGQNPTDDRWEYKTCDHLDRIKVMPAESKKMEFKPFQGKIIPKDPTSLVEKGGQCPTGEPECKIPATDGRKTLNCSSCETGKCGYSKNKDEWTCKSKCWPYCGEEIPTDGSLDQGDKCPIGINGCEYPNAAGKVPTHCKACKSQVCGYKKSNWRCRRECWPKCNNPPDNDDDSPSDDQTEKIPDGSLGYSDLCPIDQNGCKHPGTFEKVKFQCDACKSGFCGYSEKKNKWKCRKECWPIC
mmetsp:Transcript_38504/g.44869  ORF Transcript_38504/g.44869 Transcript_38504/m.44869 type:complete len:425 (+) Transcript_38504:48-1322(+)